MTRQRFLVPAVLLAVVVLAVALWPEESATRQVADDLTATDACAAPERPKLQAGSHLVGDTPPPVPYSSSPPTSGWHASGRPEPGVHEQPLTLPQHVAILEGGGVIAAYDPERLDTQDVAELQELARGPFEGQLTVTPYTQPMPTPLAMTAWGVVQRCEELDVAAVEAFVEQLHGAFGEAH